jgi:tetratricopeptide (TPR) repeat protein
MVGYVLEKSGKPEQAIRYYAEALKLKPGDELATHLMAAVEVSGN